MNAAAHSICSVESRGVNTCDIPILGGLHTVDHSREPVMQLLLDIQNYHRRRNFSHKERFGEPDPWSEGMLENLDTAISRVKQMMEDAEYSGMPVSLESSFHVAVPH